jgi:predicted dienelactone hydrolase
MRSALVVLAAVIGFAGSAAADPLAGYDRLTVTASHRPVPVAASVWYPAGSRTYRSVIGENALFVGAPALVGAAVADGRFPLVLVSHGSGGNMDGFAWLSSALAARGAMVLAVNHPGSTTGDSSPRRSILLRERAADLSAALDRLLADPAFGPHVDPSRIVAFGFSLGGTTALNLAGARMDRRRYRDYCARLGERAADCVFFARGGVDLAALPAAWEADMRDRRVAAAVAVDPGLTHAVTEASAAAMELPVLLVNLGGDGRWEAVDVGARGSDLAGRLPDARYAVVAPGGHFTALAECKPGAREILAAEEDDPICDDPEGTDRARAHDDIVAAVMAFLKR